MADHSVRLRSEMLQGSAQMPNWRANSKHHQLVGAPQGSALPEPQG
jgi:hypothetical protein